MEDKVSRKQGVKMSSGEAHEPMANRQSPDNQTVLEQYGEGSLIRQSSVEQTPAASKLEKLTQESIARSIENRRDLQEHFKHHSYVGKKRKGKYD